MLAEDAVQEAMVIACRKWSGERAQSAVFPWLRGIVRLECLRLLRERRREQPIEQTALEELIQRHWEHVWDEPDTDYLTRRVYSLRQCMAQLPRSVQQLLHDFYIRRTSAQEVLAASGEQEPVDTDALRSYLYRLRNRLRRCVRQRMNEMVAQDSEALDRLLEEYLTEGNTADAPDYAAADLATLETAPMDVLLREALQDWRTLLLALVESAETEAFEPAERVSPAMSVAPAPFPVAPRVQSRPAVCPPPSRRRTAWRWAAAAVFLALAGWGSWTWLTQSQPAVELTVAEGAATIVHGSRRTAIHGERAVRLGDEVRIPDEVLCQLRWPDDGTLFRSRGPAHLVLKSREDGAKEIALLSGVIECEAAHQPAGHPLRVTTPHGHLLVVGTRFRVHATGERTIVEVVRGRVQVLPTGGPAAEIGAGEIAVLQPGRVEKRELGGAQLEMWSNLHGNKIAPALADPHLQDPPDRSERLTQLHFAPANEENFLARIRGSLHPPRDGFYRFRIAADNAGELHMQLPSASGDHWVKIAEAPEYVKEGQWDVYPEQTSAPIYLRAGAAYPFEVLHKQGVLDSFVTVEWQRPGEPFQVIDGASLLPP